MSQLKKGICWCLSLVMICSLVSTGLVVHAEESPIDPRQGRDISDWAVTDLTVDNANLTDGQDTQVHLKFEGSQAGGAEIREGDTIQISWENQHPVMIFPYQQTMELENEKGNHEVIATVDVREDCAVVTFNSNVNGLMDVEGWLFFSIRGRNFAHTAGYHAGSVTIQAGNKKAAVSVSVNYPGGQTGNNPLYYKTGDQNKEAARTIGWDLCIDGTNQTFAQNITIQDHIQTGHRLIPDSFYISIDRVRRFFGANAFEEFAKSYPGAALKMQDDSNFEVTVPKDCASGSTVRIHYSTRIEDLTQAEFTNHSTISYQKVGDVPKTEDSNFTVNYANNDGGIQGTLPGEFRLKKVIEGTEIPVKDAKFELFREDGKDIHGQQKFLLKTDQNGIADVKNLRPGLYFLQEIEAPKYVVLDADNVWEFEIVAGAQTGIELEIPNKPAPNTGYLTVEKTVSGSAADLNQPFTFTVKLESDQIDGTFGEMEFKKGTATFPLKDNESKKATGLPVGLGYTVTESDNDGYQVTVNETDATMAKGVLQEDPAVVKFHNRKDRDPADVVPPASAVVKLTAKKTLDHAAPAGSDFTFLLKKGNDICEEVQNVGDTVSFSNLTFDQAGIYTYTISEKPGKDGKIIYDPAVYEVTITVTQQPDKYEASVSYRKDNRDYDGIPTFANQTKDDDQPTPPTDPKDPSKPTPPTDPKDPGKPIIPLQLPQPAVPVKPDVPATPTEPNVVVIPKELHVPDHVPQTGDNSTMTYWLVLMLCSGAGLFAADLYLRRHQAQRSK